MKIVILLLILFTSCSLQDRQEKNDTDLPVEPRLNFEKDLTKDLGNGLIVRNLDFDTSSIGRNCQGVHISCQIVPSTESIELLHSHGFNAFLFTWSVVYNQDVIYDSGEEIKRHTDKDYAYSQPPFISMPGVYNFHTRVAFSSLDLPCGEASVDFTLQVFPALFQTDSTLRQYQKLHSISNKPIAEWTLQKHLQTPQLYEGIISIDGFSIDHATKRKFDFTLNGNGLPDPFWELSLDNKIIYTSSVLKNTFEYNMASESPKFLVAYKDTITIRVYDHDQGPFNSRDLISEWNGAVKDLSRSKVSGFGPIRKLRLRSTFKKR